MTLPLLRPLLLTVATTSLVFFGGVIALTVQSTEADNRLSTASLVTQNTADAITSSDSVAVKSALNSFSPSSSTKQSPLAALSPAQATASAKKNSPRALLQATPELINYNGIVAYEVRLDSGISYVDANLGTVLNPVTTDSYGVKDLDDDNFKYADYKDADYKKDSHDDDDEKHKSNKHSKRKHHDKDYNDNERLIATNYKPHDEGDYDD